MTHLRFFCDRCNSPGVITDVLVTSDISVQIHGCCVRCVTAFFRTYDLTEMLVTETAA